ncbi:ABC-type dipeptide/oligopeptide/nickel transport system ATPase component [Tamaricihabitans halophyticus]|uniref:ABC-type dipeptide/oligopeptide/nickel transport system ATPase component n=1 Tax=Tamaricihabitans halophyticus TaxID=1262583 RepID=A0A4R2QPM7_9PSEU|nr:ABC transporter ATP-binding protein [Tamaricihabitans halophyticus]TCP50889.1 ABC-type dipeptide/oligopeptide/nickel transport system ATPase component [Tamaricihabitans halophyticus]
MNEGSAVGAAETLLAVRGLTVTVGSENLVRDVSFEIGRGQRLGLIGESGSGKSLTASSVIGLLPEGLRAVGSVELAGQELLNANERYLSTLRGSELAMVFQEPMTALNPAMRVGRQVAETILLHNTRPNRKAAMDTAVELLDTVRLPDPKASARAYPHQLSGGQRQRVMLAIALANEPSLLICDEPTTALDVTVQAQMVELISDATRRLGTALLFITHDLAVMAGLCERVLVMLDGSVIEAGDTRTVLTEPRHEYTQRLLAASDLEAR